MPNGIALENNLWFGPEDIAGLTTAFEAALSKLGLVDRNDPTTLTLAKLIIELATAGEREPQRLCDSALKRLSTSPQQHMPWRSVDVHVECPSVRRRNPGVGHE
jgi:hypothetical protein